VNEKEKKSFDCDRAVYLAAAQYAADGNIYPGSDF
jgi:hypothetical protein